METSKTRRAAIGIFGAAVVAAFTELRPALANGGGNTNTGTGNGPACRNAGGNCSGNQKCCPGLVCTPTGNGNSKTCQAPNPEPPNCGGHTPTVEYERCVAAAYRQQTQVCETKYGRRKQINCKQFERKSGRLRCQRRNMKMQRRYTTCTNNSVELAYAECERLRIS